MTEGAQFNPPSPGDWEWLKQLMEDSTDLQDAGARVPWILEQVRQHRAGLLEFALSYVPRMLETLTGAFVPPSGALFSQLSGAGNLFDTNDVVGNRYTVQRFLGAGGMGEVYEVADLEITGRVLALKTIRGDLLASGDARLRFEREVRVALTISHPNVCRIFDVGHHKVATHDGTATEDRLFLTMELLTGKLISDLVRPVTAQRSTSAKSGAKSGKSQPAESASTLTLVPKDVAPKPLPEVEALPILRQLAAGLAAIHKCNIVHRDFKPGNVILVPDGTATRAVIMDFGLARLIETDRDYSITQIGSYPGTPAYMSPELLTGAGSASFASDVYALGVTMHEVLTGRRYELDGSFKALQKAGVSAWLREIVIACLQSDRTKRLADAREVFRALENRGLSRFSVGNSARWASIFVMGILGIAVAWMMFTGIVPWARNQVPEMARLKYESGMDALRSAAPFLAASHFEQAIDLAPNYALALARLAEARADMDSRSQANDALAGISPESLKKLSARERDLCEALRLMVVSDHARAIPLFERLVLTADDAGKKSAEIDLAREYQLALNGPKAIELYRKLAPVSPFAQMHLAVLEYSILNLPIGKKLDEALIVFRRDHNFEGETQVLFTEANLMPLVLYPEAKAQLLKVVERARLSRDAYQETEALLRLSYLENMTDHNAESQAFGESALETARHGEGENSFSRGFRLLGVNAQARGDQHKAEQFLLKSLRAARLNRDRKNEMYALMNLGDIHINLGKPALAEQELRTAFEAQANGGSSQSALAVSVLLAAALREQGKFPEARKALADSRVLVATMQPGPLRSSALEQIERVQGQLERAQGHYPAAIGHLRKALNHAVAEKRRIAIPFIEMQLAENLAVLGDYPAADAELRLLSEFETRKNDVAGRAATIRFYANPRTISPQALMEAADAIVDPEDSMAVRILALHAATLHKDRTTIEALLARTSLRQSDELKREPALHLRIAKADAFRILGRQQEALDALGNLNDFQPHDLLAWRSLLIESLIVRDAAEAARLRGDAIIALDKFKTALGESAYKKFAANRHDLAAELKQLKK